MNGQTALYATAHNEHEAVVTSPLDHGIDVKARGHNKWTPLHVAAPNGHESVVKLLLDYGADVKRKLTEK